MCVDGRGDSRMWDPGWNLSQSLGLVFSVNVHTRMIAPGETGSVLFHRLSVKGCQTESPNNVNWCGGEVSNNCPLVTTTKQRTDSSLHLEEIWHYYITKPCWGTLLILCCPHCLHRMPVLWREAKQSSCTKGEIISFLPMYFMVSQHLTVINGFYPHTNTVR